MTTPAHAYKLLRHAGVSPAKAAILTAVGGAESSWNPHATGDVSLEDATWGPSVGIWQIRTLKSQTGTGGTRDINKLRGHPAAQARAAASILRGQGLDAWTTYRTGAYKTYLGAAGGIDPGPGVQNAGLLPDLPNIGGLDPFAWGGAIKGGMGAIAGAGGDKVSGGVTALWHNLRSTLITALVGLGGVALLVVGAAVAANIHPPTVLGAAS